MTDRTGKSVSGWTDREFLICLLNLMDNTDVKLKFDEGIYPSGRNASGFKQKYFKMKRELKPELDAIQAGGAVDTANKKKAANDMAKAKTGRKRKAGTDGEDDTTKKRGRAKKSSPPVAEEDDSESAMPVKEEPEEEVSSSV